MTAPYKEGDFERAIEAYLTDEARGDTKWLKGSSQTYDKQLGLDPTELLAFIHDTQQPGWDKLVKVTSGDEVKAQNLFLSTAAKMLNSQGVLALIRRGLTVHGVEFKLAYFKPEHGLTQKLSELYAANRTTVVRQFSYSQANDNTLDLVLFLNGIPVATVELKNKLTHQTVENAKAQYRTDRDPRELLFAKRAIAHFAVDTDQVFVATELAGESTRFLPFNRGFEKGAGNPPGEAGKYATSYLWEDIFQRDNWLDLLRRFVHLQKQGGREGIIFPRYHQLEAVRRTVADARKHGPGKNYLIEHSAGSGKSNTISWLAHRLAVLHGANDELVFDKVIIVTDRVVLDRQLGATIYQFEHVSGLVERAQSSSNELVKALESNTSRVVISTLQKFPFVLGKLTESSDLAKGNYAIVIDEAHSSQGGEAAKALRQALGAETLEKLEAEAEESAASNESEGAENSDGLDVQDLLAASVKARGRQDNLSYFAFTATPTRRTLELFGTPTADGARYEPFHLYSMRQAIEEGFILDVLKRYTPYSVLWKVATGPSGDADKEVDKGKATRAVVQFVTRHPRTLKEKADIIVEHFHNTVAPRIGGHAKAMVMCASRELAIRTHAAIEKAAQAAGYSDCSALVAFSGTINVDGKEYTEASINGFGEKELPGKFATDDYRILVVADKYQTGFDQPLLQTLYVDKKLTGVRAVQALSRANRIHPGKDDAFVLDFVNDAASMTAAFKPFYEGTVTEATDPAEMYVAHGNLYSHGVVDAQDERAFAAAFLVIDPADATAHAQLLNHLQPALDRLAALDEDDQNEFRAALAKFVDIYGFLAQAVGFNDTNLESTYLYGRHLQRVLPRTSQGSLDLGGDIVLTHLRISGGSETNVGPADGGELIPGETGDTVPGVPHDKDVLKHIIDDLNSRFGSDLDDQDRVLLEKLLNDLGEDAGLLQEAKVNSLDNFILDFAQRFEDEVVDAENTSRLFFERFFSDNDFRDALVRGAGEEYHRRHSGEGEAEGHETGGQQEADAEAELPEENGPDEKAA